MTVIVHDAQFVPKDRLKDIGKVKKYQIDHKINIVTLYPSLYLDSS